MRNALVVVILLFSTAAAAEDQPSRPPVEKCAWERIRSGSFGLEAWVQRCDFGFRKIDFVFKGSSLYVRYSDGGAPDPLVDVLALEPEEPAETGVKRIFAARTDRAVAQRCVLAPFKGNPKPPAGVKRYTFVPDAAYAKELAAKANPDEVPEPPCGELGESADGIRYFETHPTSRARKVLFVRVGQDEPLFDEQTLKLIAPKPGPDGRS